MTCTIGSADILTRQPLLLSRPQNGGSRFKAERVFCQTEEFRDLGSGAMSTSTVSDDFELTSLLDCRRLRR